MAVAVVPGVLGAGVVLVPRADLIADGAEPWVVTAALTGAAIAFVGALVLHRRRRRDATPPEVIDLRQPVSSLSTRPLSDGPPTGRAIRQGTATRGARRS
ncbi:MAG: hypothetical protein M3R01_12930 [Actinomycetota bacterium]|nr:hypothetical protein [Acidimicrobiia bacterium]MDQ3147810.1 hypothetical protein [Actinomycetota bacterium]